MKSGRAAAWRRGVMEGREMNRMRSLLRIVALGIMVTAATTPALAGAHTAGFTPVAPMHHARAFQTATELLNGDILVAGGYDGSVVLPGGAGSPGFPESDL